MLPIRDHLKSFMSPEQRDSYDSIYWFVHPQGYRAQGRTFIQCACIIEFCLTTGMPAYLGNHSDPIDNRGERSKGYHERGITVGILNKLVQNLNDGPYKSTPIDLKVSHYREYTRVEIMANMPRERIEKFIEGGTWEI